MKAEGKLIKDVMAFFKDKNADKKWFQTSLIKINLYCNTI